jgi:hypothetical protein
MISYTLTMTHPQASKNWTLSFSDKREAMADYNFFHKLGMSVSLRERITETTGTEKIILSDWNPHLTQPSIKEEGK